MAAETTLEQEKRNEMERAQEIIRRLIGNAEMFDSVPPETLAHLRVANIAVSAALESYNRVMTALDEARRERIARELNQIADAVLTMEPADERPWSTSIPGECPHGFSTPRNCRKCNPVRV